MTLFGLSDESLRERTRAHFPKDGPKVYVRTSAIVVCTCGATNEGDKTSCSACHVKFSPEVLQAVAQADGLDRVRIIPGRNGPNFSRLERWRDPPSSQ